MRYWLCVIPLLVASQAYATDIDEVLATVPGTTGDEQDFMAGVTWSNDTEKAYYACTERLDMQTLELWVNGAETMARARGVPDRPLKYGKNGPVQVLSYYGESGSPIIATYLLLPSGEAHIFRVTPEQRIVKASKKWQCKRGEWREP